MKWWIINWRYHEIKEEEKTEPELVKEEVKKVKKKRASKKRKRASKKNKSRAEAFMNGAMTMPLPASTNVKNIRIVPVNTSVKFT